MGQSTAISWAHHTFNPVWGCFEVGPECDNCYARTFAKRVGHGGHWGVDAGFRTFGEKHWAEPLKWDADAKAAGERRRVFCASMADVGDDRWPYGVHAQLWNLIKATPNLDWMLLTKRIHLLKKLLPKDWGNGYPNVWLGVTCGTQAGADVRVPQLLATPARVRFLSCEPLLGPINLDHHLGLAPGHVWAECLCSEITAKDRPCLTCESRASLGQITGLHWVIAGGESGGKARPMHPAWARSLRDQCAAAGVAFHFKQWGQWAPGKIVAGGDLGGDMRADRARWVPPVEREDFAAKRGDALMRRVKSVKDSGRELDGVVHDAFPVPA